MKNLNLKTKANDTKGITLVALVISIIVLLILATVSINLVINNGILDKAKTAVDKYSEGEIEEQIKLAYLEWQTAQLTGTTESANDFIKNRLNSSIGNVEDVSVDDSALIVTISKDNGEKTYYYNIKSGTTKQIELAKKSNNINDSYVGCYADIDGNGTVDGIIFVDLLTGSIKETQNFGTYTLPKDVTLENVNTYYISQSSYTDSHFGTNKVISPIGNGKARFYVMQLTNFTTPEMKDGNNQQIYPAYTSYYWYKNANGHMSPLVTSNDFGKGNENTGKMIEKWNAAGTTNGYIDSAQDNRDIWKHIQTIYDGGKGWFVPSIAEWSAFANELGITSANSQSVYGLDQRYYSSSQIGDGAAWGTKVVGGSINNWPVYETHTIRLVTTF